jgi:hypothetical protein
MKVFTKSEEDYYRNIIDNKMNLVNEFNYNFIAKFIRKTLGNKEGVGEIKTLLTRYNETKDVSCIENEIIGKYLVAKFSDDLNFYFNQTSSNISYKNIIELVNIIFNSNIEEKRYYPYICIERLSNEICGFTSDLLVLPTHKYIRLIEYKIFNFDDIDKIDDFGRELLKEVADLFFYYYRKENKDIAEANINYSLERAIKLYNIYMHKFIKQGFDKEEPYKRKDYAYNKFKDVLRIMNENSNLDIYCSSDKYNYKEMKEKLEPYISGGSESVYKSVVEKHVLPKDSPTLRMENGKKADIYRFRKCFDIPIPQINKIFDIKIDYNNEPDDFVNPFFHILKEINPNFIPKRKKTK